MPMLLSGLRQLRTARLHSALVVLTLTIGVAGATAMAGVLRGVLYHPLPYAAPDRLLQIEEFSPARGSGLSTMSLAALEDTRNGTRSFASLAGFSFSEFVLSGDVEAERVIGVAMEAGGFDVLGARPLLGRSFRAGEDGATPAPVAVIASRLWRRRFHGDPAILGRSIVVDGEPVTVIGVMGPGFEFPRSRMMSDDPELWVPLAHSPQMAMRRGRRSLMVIARIRDDVTLGQSNIDLGLVGADLGIRYRAVSDGWSIRGRPLKDYMVGEIRPALLMLAACVLILAVLASVNAAAALLSRTIQRRHSLAVRMTLGATRASLRSLLLLEAATLGLAAGLLALPASAVLQRVLLGIAPTVIPRQDQIRWDLVTLMMALVSGLGLSLLAAGASLGQVRGLDPAEHLREGNRGSTGGRSMRRGLAALVVAQLALATILAAVTAGVYRDYRRLNRVDPGFVGTDVLTATIALAGPRYRTIEARTALTEQYLDAVRALPGVSHAAVVSLLPLSGGLMSAPFVVGGAASGDSTTAALRAVSADFFTTVQIPLRQGRAIDASDASDAQPSVVVSEALVRAALGGAEPLGATIRVSAPGTDSAGAFRIVGVVGDTRERDLSGPPMPMIYFSNRQTSFPHSVLVVRSTDPAVARALRGALGRLDPSLALDDVGSLADKVAATYALQRFYLVLLAAFGLCAATLVAAGVYGLMSSVVTAEAKPMALRLALGASAAGILMGVLRRTAGLAGVGCGIGVALSLALPGAGTSGFAATLGGGLGILMVALAASLIPAVRAGRADPASVLKE